MHSTKDLQEIVNAEIIARTKELAEKKPNALYAPVEYALNMGGKRLRPVLLLLGYSLFAEDIENALPAAVAIEVFHNFTLLHDDIMDKAEVRRNRPTVHKQFSENNAVLSGDVMAFLSYQYLMECKSEKWFEVAELFTQTAVEVCEGQQLDMDFEDRLDVSASEYLEMIKLKTAVLLGCGLKAGAFLANSPDEVAADLYDFGLNLGMAFQLQDDLLDTFGEQKTFGKKIGGDIIANKKTYLLIKALERADENQLNQLKNWINKKNFNATEKIAGVTEIYNQLEIEDMIRAKIDDYFSVCSGTLENLSLDENKKMILRNLSNELLNRNH